MERALLELPPDVYAQRLTEAWVAGLVERRLAVGLSPYATAIPGLLTAQTVRNIEAGVHSPSLWTLGLLSHRLQWDVEQGAREAARRLRP